MLKTYLHFLGVSHTEQFLLRGACHSAPFFVHALVVAKDGDERWKGDRPYLIRVVTRSTLPVGRGGKWLNNESTNSITWNSVVMSFTSLQDL